MEELDVKMLVPSDTQLIGTIADWYHRHWSVPVERTRRRLGQINPEDIVFQLVLEEKGQEIGTGGLYFQVGLFVEHPRFRVYGPWVALLYTIPEKRNRGAGQILLDAIESAAMEKGYKTIYLYTFTAESLYLRAGWRVMERVNYKGHDTAVMKKEIS